MVNAFNNILYYENLILQKTWEQTLNHAKNVVRNMEL